jgi:hypothetical protein
VDLDPAASSSVSVMMVVMTWFPEPRLVGTQLLFVRINCLKKCNDFHCLDYVLFKKYFS